MLRWLVPLVIASACGYPRPADVLGDGEDGPRLMMRVSPTGDDSNDGFTTPVRTLKRALVIAATHTEAVAIMLDAGRYELISGESFPYTINSHVTIAGAVSGGTILAGSSTAQGFIVDSSTLRDVELEDFTIAIKANGTTQLTNINIRQSDVAIRAESSAIMTANKLNITGAQGSCSIGFDLEGASLLVAADVTTQNLGTSLRAQNTSSVKLSRAAMTGDSACDTVEIIQISSKGEFTLIDSALDKGHSGITFLSESAPTSATITNTKISNTKSDGISGSNVVLHIRGGELSGNLQGGIATSGGEWNLNNVTIKQNSAFGVYARNSIIEAHDCTFSENGTGIRINTSNRTDLGTPSSNGKNVIRNNRVLGLLIEHGTQTTTAVGNFWQPSIQDADNLGRYDFSVISGPIIITQGNNYAILDGSELQR